MQLEIRSALNADSSHLLDIEPATTLLDLRYQLFSVTDIPPERILLHFAGNTQPPNDETDGETTLSTAGITPTTTVTYSDSENPLPNSQPPSSGTSKPQKQAITLADLEAALRHCGTRAPSRQPVVDNATQHFLARVRSYQAAIVAYESKELQSKALAVVPLQALQTQAKERQRTDSKYLTYELALAKELLHWFKNSFFTWVNEPLCWSCGKKTAMLGVVQPNASEKRHDASRTELYSCNSCGAQTRFARYNAVAKLLETRRGRCGEWAQAFTLIARAAGFAVRAVHDWTDHVWTEVWCGRWVHADACEDVLDEPLLYERGWNKKLNYCMATGVDCVADVTRRYTERFEEVRGRRTLAEEGALQAGLRKMNDEVVGRLAEDERMVATKRYEEDMVGLVTGASGGGQALPGRQSGSKDWVESRGEGGSGS